MTTRYFDPYRRNYRSLSVKDLLDARESRHIQLMAMENVIGTAIFDAGGGKDTMLAKSVTNARVRKVYANEEDTFVPSFTLSQWIENVAGV